ncbi:MAG: FkbM family methyltransferase [Alphaproteobacteria bacterium]|nr:FkbM family methyltransferase [Alphaproteobacteria bacterium]MBQ6888572.1 FkbM family methyltransferase [Lachnospiraceae bacterium]
MNNTNIPYEFSKEAMRKVKYMSVEVSYVDKMQKFYFSQNEEHVSCSIVNLQDTEEYFEAKCYTYKTLLQKLQVEKFKLIKIDVEGMEYEVINSIIESGNLPNVMC